tara:strand:+ start:12492 stop:15371 length:2880 start_codon:yes stop_codon:yes gene_type:complete
MAPQAVAAAVVATTATAAANFVGAALVTGFVAASLTTVFVTTLVLSGISMALQKKPKINPQGSMAARSQMVKQPLISRKIVYGRQKVSGGIVYMKTTGKSEFLHMIVAIASNELNSIEKIFFNDDELTLDGSGNVTAPSQYAGKAQVLTGLGRDDQLSNATIALNTFGFNSPSGVNTNDRFRGIAYIYAKLTYDTDAFPNGIPNISAIVQGKKVLDTRTSATAFSSNPVLILRDYLTDTKYGLGSAASEIDTTSFNAAANVCDEDVALAAGGTENRYEAHGVIDTENQPKQIIEEILSSMAGSLYYSGGKWYVKAGAYSAPSETITEDDLMGAITINTKPSRRDNFNAVKGVFLPAEDGNFQPTDYTPITSGTFQTEDNGEQVFTNLDLPFTQSSSMAQRIAKINLFKARQQLTMTLPCKLTAFRHNVGDTIMVTLDRFGFSSKVFEIVNWQFASSVSDDGSATLGVDLTVRELASSVYDWSAEETEFLADNTDLRSPFDILAPSVTTSDELRVINEEAIDVLLVDISSGDNLAVQFEVQAKKTTDSTFTSLGISSSTRFEMINVEAGATYDVRARSITGLGNKSAFTSVTQQITASLDLPADVTNFSVNIIGKEAHLSWTPVPDLDLSHYIVRHSDATSGAAFNTSRTLAKKVSRPANTVIVPAITGTYLIKSVDKGGRESRNATATIAIINEIDPGNVVQTLTENPTFSGTKSDVAVSDGALVLATTLLFDSATGNFDDLDGLFDGGGSTVDNEGTYDFATVVDLGSKFTSRVTSKVEISRVDYVNVFDDAAGLFDAREGFFDGDTSSFGDTNATLQIATTDDDPSGSPTFTDFREFVVGEYSARAFKFRAVLNSNDTSASPKVETLQVTVDMPDRFEHGNDIASGTDAGGKTVTFSPAFSSLENVAITAQNMESGDFFVVSSKSATGFNVVFKNSSNAVINRTFDFQAKGFGAVIS